MDNMRQLDQHLLYKMFYINLLPRPKKEHEQYEKKYIQLVQNLLYKMIYINLQAGPIIEHG